MNTSKKPVKIIVAVMLAALALAAAAGLVASLLLMAQDDDTQPALSPAAQPYEQELEQAAQQCPSVLTAQRLDRYINDATGWDTNYESPVLVTVSVAGMTEETWDTTGGGDPNDVPTAIRNVANLWCDHATTLAGEDLDLDYNLPDPAHGDDDPRAAALGLAAIYMGIDNVRSDNLGISHHPTVEQSMNAVL